MIEIDIEKGLGVRGKIIPKEKGTVVVPVLNKESSMFRLMYIEWMHLGCFGGIGAGVMFGYMATATNSLIGPIIAHGFGNFILHLIASYPLV